MSVYVDSLLVYNSASYRGTDSVQARRVGARHGHRWCHLFATTAGGRELHAFARRLGLRREWFQGNHYDLTPTKREHALRLGAVSLDRKHAVAVWRAQRAA